MNLEEKINADLKKAMLAKDEAALRGLRAVKSAILLAKTSGNSAELTEADELKILQKQIKQRKESIEVYQQQGRSDLVKQEQEEIDTIEKYLPQMMSEEDIHKELVLIIAELGATGPGDLGKVMGAASKKFSGKADNKLVSTLVRNLLGA